MDYDWFTKFENAYKYRQILTQEIELSCVKLNEIQETLNFFIEIENKMEEEKAYII